MRRASRICLARWLTLESSDIYTHAYSAIDGATSIELAAYCVLCAACSRTSLPSQLPAAPSNPPRGETGIEYVHLSRSIHVIVTSSLTPDGALSYTPHLLPREETRLSSSLVLPPRPSSSAPAIYTS